MEYTVLCFQKFDVLEQLKTDNADISFERISLFEDMKTECDQRAIYERFLANTAPLDATNVVCMLYTNIHAS